jgi:hypothetical protein
MNARYEPHRAPPTAGVRTPREKPTSASQAPSSPSRHARKPTKHPLPWCPISHIPGHASPSISREVERSRPSVGTTVHRHHLKGVARHQRIPEWLAADRFGHQQAVHILRPSQTHVTKGRHLAVRCRWGFPPPDPHQLSQSQASSQPAYGQLSMARSKVHQPTRSSGVGGIPDKTLSASHT